MKVNVGDIFYNNNGLVKFYQIIKVYESGRIKIRKVEEKELKWLNEYEKKVKPDINNFSKEDKFLKNDNKGVIRLVNYSSNIPCIRLKYNTYCYLWDKKPIISSYHKIWMK